MDSLVTKTTPKDVQTALGTLPKGLDNTYNEVMTRVDSQNDDYRILAQEVLSWVVYAVWPLSVEELQHALAVKPGVTQLDEDDLPDKGTLISVCAGLVIVDQKSNVVRLVHHTTQKFLEEIHKDHLIDIHTEMATVCLTYLSFDIFGDWSPLDHLHSGMKTMSIYLRENTLLGYAARHWLQHVHAGSEENIKGLSVQFLKEERKMWFCLQAKAVSELESDGHCTSSPPTTAFQFAIMTNLKETVEEFLAGGVDVNAQGGEYANPLQAALYSGHEQMVRLLFEKGADVNAQGGHFGNALQGASCRGHEQVVRLLLEKGADVNAQGGYFGNALQAASCGGHEQVVRLLLEKGADVNAQGGHFSNALQAASNEGHKQVVRLLLENGAEVKVQ